MPSKSSLHVVIDNGSGITIEVQDDASGYLVVQMSDGSKPLAMKLSASDAHQLSRVIMASDLLRAQAPSS